jgi:hypothetical protein
MILDRELHLGDGVENGKNLFFGEEAVFISFYNFIQNYR